MAARPKPPMPRRPRFDRAKRMAGKIALATALGASMVGVPRALEHRIARTARARVEQELTTTRNELRYSDLREAQREFDQWKGLRDFDSIVIELAESFPERAKTRAHERQSIEPRGHASPRLAEMDDALARQSPEEVKSIMDQAQRQGTIGKRERQDWESSITTMRRELKEYLAELESRAPARIQSKLRWIQTELGLGTGLFAAGMYIAITRALRRRKLSPSQIEYYSRFDRGTPAIEHFRGGRVRFSFRHGNLIRIEDQYRVTDRKTGDPKVSYSIVTEYDVKTGKPRRRYRLDANTWR